MTSDSLVFAYRVPHKKIWSLWRGTLQAPKQGEGGGELLAATLPPCPVLQVCGGYRCADFPPPVPSASGMWRIRVLLQAGALFFTLSCLPHLSKCSQEEPLYRQPPAFCGTHIFLSAQFSTVLSLCTILDSEVMCFLLIPCFCPRQTVYSPPYMFELLLLPLSLLPSCARYLCLQKKVLRIDQFPIF